jgi:hypothetical protein
MLSFPFMVFLPLLSFLVYCAVANIEKDNFEDTVNDQFCFLTAFSSNHFQAGLAHIASMQAKYPCQKTYIYDIGLSKHEASFLKSFPFIKMLPLHTGRPFFPGNAKAFKPPMILDFMKRYRVDHNCRFFMYGDSCIMMHQPFTNETFEEVRRMGLITEVASRYPQVEYTHPKMYTFFGLDREEDYLKTPAMKQTQSGLMLVDAENVTMRDGFFTEWAACANNLACLAPDNITTQNSGSMLSVYPLKNGQPIFR